MNIAIHGSLNGTIL